MIVDINPSWKQHQAMQKLIDDITIYITFGGAGNGGKSWLGCMWLVSMCYMYPGTRYFIGREELKRLRDSTLITLFKVFKYYHIPIMDWKYNGQDHFIQFSNGSLITLMELKYLPSDPFYERYGSIEYTSGWIEEGGEIHFDAFDTLKSRINRWMNDEYNLPGKLLITCNPKRNWLYSLFYKPWKANKLPENCAFIQSLVGDNPYREKDSEQRLKDITNKAKRERLLYGNWNYEDEPDQLIQYIWLENCLSAKWEKGSQALGVDVARFGDDLSAISKWQGNRLTGLKSYDDFDIVAIATIVGNKIQEEKINTDLVGIDTVGLGAGVYDILNKQKMKCSEIVSGSSAVEEKDNEYLYFNLRSQMWWTAREEIRKKEISIYEEVPQLFEDLTAPKYEISGDKTIRIESKKDIKVRIGRSPDLGDAFVYGNWIRKPRAKKRRLVAVKLN